MESYGPGVAEVRALHGARRVRRRLRGRTAFAVKVAEITGNAEGARHLASGQGSVVYRTSTKTFRIGRPDPDQRADLQRAAEDAERRVADLLGYLQRVLDTALRRADAFARLLAVAVRSLTVLGPSSVEIDRQRAALADQRPEGPPGQLLTAAPAVPHGPPRPLGPSYQEALAA